MFFYSAFGLCVSSEIEIPQFLTAPSRRPDVHIRMGKLNEFETRDEAPAGAIRIGPREFFFFWETIGSYLVRNGDEIIVNPKPGVKEEFLRLPLIGILSAALLQQRGKLVLHASAVSMDQNAVVFVGWKGAGKSTTAATLYARGHSLISDDVVAITDPDAEQAAILPAFPCFKLLPETISATLADDPETLTRIYEGAEKRYRSSADNFLNQNIPLKAIYTLEDGPELRSTLLNPQEAIATLIANTYCARYGSELIRNEDAITTFRECARIVNKVPIFRLERPRSYVMLQDLGEFLEAQHTGS